MLAVIYVLLQNRPISWEIVPWNEAIFVVKFVKHLYKYTEYDNKLVQSPVDLTIKI